jgi:hypothetical protein
MLEEREMNREEVMDAIKRAQVDEHDHNDREARRWK